MPTISFNNKNSVFFNEVKSEVNEYFRQHQLKKTGNWKLYLKSGILIPMAIGLYVFLLAFPLPPLFAILCCALLGFVLACIGFNVMHDACHGSYSSKKWVNKIFGYTMNALGGNEFFWREQHNIVHHTYTNIDGEDDDIAKSPLLRLCETQKWLPAHRLQHIYVPFLYAIMSLGWVLGIDFVKYFRRKIEHNSFKMDWKQHLIFWLSKVAYVVVYILIPGFVVGWGEWAIGFVIVHIVCGFTLAIVFQLAHVVEKTEFEVANEDHKVIESEWAIHQVKTTADFATQSKIISWFLGGLNFQIEHHLFPRVSHVHYPAISKIVKKVCQHHGLPYHQFPSVTSAIASHFRFIKKLGRKPVVLVPNA